MQDTVAHADRVEDIQEEREGRSPKQGVLNELPNGGEEELPKDSMMSHLIDSLDEGKDIGHYGRLMFAMPNMVPPAAYFPGLANSS